MATEQHDLSRRSMLKFAGATVAAAAVFKGTAFAAALSPAKLLHTEVGTGKNVMFLHGWTCDSNDWIEQLPLFESRYHVVAPDLRGHGRSEVMPSGAYMPDDYVADIEALISTKYPGQTFILIGHSMGGQIAGRLAVKRPDLVSAIVSIDGALGFGNDAGQLFRKTVDDLNAGDPAFVAPALFELRPAFLREGSGWRRGGKRKILQATNSALLSPVPRSQSGRSDAIMVLASKI